MGEFLWAGVGLVLVATFLLLVGLCQAAARADRLSEAMERRLRERGPIPRHIPAPALVPVRRVRQH